jgi:hypothetical protein
MNIENLTSGQLRAAANLQDKIASLQAELASFLGASTPSVAGAPRRKGGMSAAGRARIAAAQRARWAKFKKSKGATAAAPKKGRRKMSPAARARLAAIAKARWQKAKAQGQGSL